MSLYEFVLAMPDGGRVPICNLQVLCTAGIHLRHHLQPVQFRTGLTIGNLDVEDKGHGLNRAWLSDHIVADMNEAPLEGEMEARLQFFRIVLTSQCTLRPRLGGCLSATMLIERFNRVRSDILGLTGMEPVPSCESLIPGKLFMAVPSIAGCAVEVTSVYGALTRDEETEGEAK